MKELLEQASKVYSALKLWIFILSTEELHRLRDDIDYELKIRE